MTRAPWSWACLLGAWCREALDWKSRVPCSTANCPHEDSLSSLRTAEDEGPLLSSLKNLTVAPHLNQQEKNQLCYHSRGHLGFPCVPPPRLYPRLKPFFWIPRFSQLCWARRSLCMWLHGVGDRQPSQQLMWNPF